ncbi:MAG: YlxR family protein [Deltaproteobacteria bacterium]|nr:YlxR family protein [Deltaproteobacteria bacterium]
MSRGKGHIPIRTCISCDARRDKKDLVRLILNADGMIIRDVDGKGAGRGAYVCPDDSCLRRLKTSKRLKRAFRTGGVVAVDPDFFGAVNNARSRESENQGGVQTIMNCFGGING